MKSNRLFFIFLSLLFSFWELKAQDYIFAKVTLENGDVLLEIKNCIDDTVLFYANDWIVLSTKSNSTQIRRAVSNALVFSNDSFNIFFNRHASDCSVVYWDTLKVLKNNSFVKIAPQGSKLIRLPVQLHNKNYKYVFCHFLYSFNSEAVKYFSSHCTHNFNDYQSSSCNEEKTKDDCIYFFNRQKTALIKKHEFALLFFDKMRWYHQLHLID